MTAKELIKLAQGYGFGVVEPPRERYGGVKSKSETVSPAKAIPGKAVKAFSLAAKPDLSRQQRTPGMEPLPEYAAKQTRILGAGGKPVGINRAKPSATEVAGPALAAAKKKVPSTDTRHYTTTQSGFGFGASAPPKMEYQKSQPTPRESMNKKSAIERILAIDWGPED